MQNAERTAIDMIRRYGTREAAIQQTHSYDVEAVMDEERAFWRAVLAELRSYDRLIEAIIKQIEQSGRAVDRHAVASALAAQTNMVPGDEVNRIVASFARRKHVAFA
jgi:hypothetical protein